MIQLEISVIFQIHDSHLQPIEIEFNLQYCSLRFFRQ